MRAILILFIVFITLIPLARSTENESKIWFGLFGKKALSQDYFLHSEAQLRYALDSGGMQQTIIRFGPLKKINEYHEVGLLMAFSESKDMREYRPTLQHTQRFNNFSGRSRLEARFLEDNQPSALRFRYQLKGQKPINEKVDLVIWEEPFFNLTQESWNGDRFFDRNRVFIGTSIDYIGNKIDVGYMNQYIPRDTVTYEHVLVVYFSY